VNFLLHRHFAALELGSEASGIGAMLPDLWRMADRRVKPSPPRAAARVPAARGGEDEGAERGPGEGDPRSAGSILDEVLAGVDHHIEIDRWFHRIQEFENGERACAERLKASGASAPRLGLFAHIVWEMALDGALVRKVGLHAMLDLLRRGFASTEDARALAARSRGLTRALTTPEERAAFELRMQRLSHEIARGPWIESYQTGAGLALCLAGVRARLGMAAFERGDPARLEVALERVAADAAGALDAIVSRRAAG
jgi:hypothetical protein